VRFVAAEMMLDTRFLAMTATLVECVEQPRPVAPGHPPAQTIRVPACLRRFLREGTPWRSLRTDEQKVSGSTLRRWDDGPLWKVLAQQADRLVGGADAYLVIDDTALPKKGMLSVGVARQYCGQLGKRANCQALVSLTLAQGEVPVPVGLRVFLPDEWTGDAERCARAGVPETEVTQLSKGAIALAELDRVAAAGVRFGMVLADAGYGASAAFRHRLDARGLRWAEQPKVPAASLLEWLRRGSASRATRRSMM
jgi:hypothetical protein